MIRYCTVAITVQNKEEPNKQNLLNHSHVNRTEKVSFTYMFVSNQLILTTTHQASSLCCANALQSCTLLLRRA